MSREENGRCRSGYVFLQTKKDILDAKFEQESARCEPDVVRLELLERLRIK